MHRPEGLAVCMNQRDRNIFLTALLMGRGQFLDMLCCLPEEAAQCHPSPEGWSILECVEHVVLAERYFLEQIRSAEALAEPAVNKLRESAILAYGVNRDRAAQSPQELVPRGLFRTQAEAVQGFLACRQATMDYVRHCDQDLTAMRVRQQLMGPMTAYEMLLMLCSHADRHRLQIFSLRRYVCDWLGAFALPPAARAAWSRQKAAAVARCA